MALPTTAFTGAKIIDHWIEYPFEEFGDITTKVYRARCMVNVDEYTTLKTGIGNLSNASAAGVLSLPASFIDPFARFVGDSTPTSSSGGTCQFVRTFANVPASHTDYSTATYTSPPEFASKVEPILFINDPTGGPNIATRTRRYEYTKKPAETKVVSVRLLYSYRTSPSSVTIRTEESFFLEKSDARTYRTFYQGDPVTETDEGETTVIPTGDNNVIVGTQINKWMGDIYEVVTGYKA